MFESYEGIALAAELAKLDPNRCESCYGAESAEMKCCNTCANVREAYVFSQSFLDAFVLTKTNDPSRTVYFILENY